MKNSRPEAASKAWLFLPALMVAGAALRVYGITRESLWWDEYASHVHLDASSLVEFLLLNRTLDPLTLPFYYIFEYLWAHYVHDSVLSLRLLSVGIGVATIPLLYLLGKRIHGAGAGYVAAALLVVSPVHIHHAQGIRMYVMLVFLAALMVWSFLRLLDNPRFSWWALHGAISFFLYWTHPFAGLATAALGVFLLIHYRSLCAMFWRWTCMQALLLAPTGAYLASVRFWPQDTTGDWIAHPTLTALAADIFFDDITIFHWQFRLGDFAQQLGHLRWIPDLLLAALIVALTALLCMRTMSASHRDYSARQSFVLLFSWLTLPPVMLFIVSWTVRPCMFPRYTVHCMLAMFLLLGWATQCIRSPWRRRLVSTLLAALTLTQWVWLQPGPQRTDWRSAGLLLHEQTTAHDIVLVDGLLWRDVFVHNLAHMTPGPLDAPVAGAEKTPVVAAQAALCLGLMSASDAALASGRAWAVVALDYFEPGPPEAFEALLNAWGVGFERWFFPAIREIYVYRMEAHDQETPPSSMEALLTRRDLIEPERKDREGDIGHHAMQAFGDLGLELALAGRTDMAMDILDGLFAVSAFGRQIHGNLRDALESGDAIANKAEAIRAVWAGYGHRDNRQPVFTRRAFARAAALDPDHVIAHFELGVELAEAGDYAGARNALSRTVEIDGAYRDMLRSLLDALETGKDAHTKLEAVVAYRHALLALGQADIEKAEALLRDATKLDPALSAAHLMLGYVLTLHDVHDEAEAALTRYLNTSETPDVDAYAHMALIQAEQGRATLARETLNRLFENDPTARNVYGSLLEAVDADGDAQLAAASIRAVWAGFEARRKTRVDEARDAFTRAVELNPDNTFAHLELGLELAAAGDHDGARDALRQVSARDPGYADMLRYLLRDLESGVAPGNSLEAVRAYRRGLLAQNEGRHDDAVRQLDQAIAADPRLDDAHTSRVFVLVVQRRLDEAFSGIQRYIEAVDTPEPGAFGLLAVIHLARNEPGKARDAARRAVAMDTGYAAQFGPMFHALLEDHDLEAFVHELDILKSQGINLYPLMYDFSAAYLAAAQ